MDYINSPRSLRWEVDDMAVVFKQGGERREDWGK